MSELETKSNSPLITGRNTKLSTNQDSFTTQNLPLATDRDLVRQSLTDTPQVRPASGSDSPFSSAPQDIARIRSEMIVDFDSGKVTWQGRKVSLTLEDPSLGSRNHEQLVNDIAVILFVSNGAVDQITIDAQGRLYPLEKSEVERANQLASVLKSQGKKPEELVTRTMQDSRLIVLGELHDDNGRYLSKELVEAAVDGGATVLFMEVSQRDQHHLDNFMRTGDPKALEPVNLFADHPYNVPIIEALQLARERGVKVLAVDDLNLGLNVEARDLVSAAKIQQYFRDNPRAKGVFIIGEHHIERGSLGIDNILKRSLGENAVVSIGRSYAGSLFSTEEWARLALAVDPTSIGNGRIVPSSAIPFESRDGSPTDYDFVFFYPSQRTQI